MVLRGKLPVMRTLPQRAPVRLIRRVIEKSGADDVGTLGAALTYQTLLSLIPIVLLAASVVGFVFDGDATRTQRWIEAIAGAVPGLEDAVGRSIEALVDARLQAGLIAVATLVWTGSAMAGTGSHALARIFGVSERRWHVKRLRSLLELLVLGTAALVAIALTSFLPAGSGALLSIGALAIGFAVDLAMFLLVYVVLTPPGGPPIRGHLPGAMLVTLTWTALKLAGGWYVRIVVIRASAIYGTIGALIGLIAILSLAARAFLFGAELSAVLGLSRRREAPTGRS